MEGFTDAFSGFIALLLLPLLGVLSLLRKRAVPWLAATLLAWALLRSWILRRLPPEDPSRPRLAHAYWIGLALGFAFLAVAWIQRRRRVARWLRFTLATLTVAAFLRALWTYVATYA